MHHIRSRRFSVPAAVATLALALSACADFATPPTAPPPSAANPGLLGLPIDLPPLPLPLPTILVCPSLVTERASEIIGPEGGSITAGAITISIPPGAVDEEERFEVVAPASLLMETEIHAEGKNHYTFDGAATITMSLARCPLTVIPSNAKGAYVEDGSYKVLEWMGGSYDRERQSFSFSTKHLSSYVIAY